MIFIIKNNRNQLPKWQRIWGDVVSWLQCFWFIAVFATVVMAGTFLGFNDIMIIPRIVATIVSGAGAVLVGFIGFFILAVFVSTKMDEEQEKHQKRIREESIAGIMNDRNCSRKEAEKALDKWESEYYEEQGEMMAKAIIQIFEEEKDEQIHPAWN